jgi:RHS repeat-associated protein
MVYFTRGTGNAPGVGDVIAETRICSSLTQTYFYVKNHRGDTIALVNEAGVTVGTYQYDAWGQVTVHTGTNAWFTFSSKRYDPDAKLYYYGFRWYDPESKRWTQPDPSGIAEGLDLYRFCDNDPVNGVDVYGEFVCVIFADLSQWWLDKLESGPLSIWTGNVYIDTAYHGLAETWLDLQGGKLLAEFVLASEEYYDRFQHYICNLGNNKYNSINNVANELSGKFYGKTKNGEIIINRFKELYEEGRIIDNSWYAVIKGAPCLNPRNGKIYYPDKIEDMGLGAIIHEVTHGMQYDNGVFNNEYNEAAIESEAAFYGALFDNYPERYNPKTIKRFAYQRANDVFYNPIKNGYSKKGYNLPYDGLFPVKRLFPIKNRKNRKK